MTSTPAELTAEIISLRAANKALIEHAAGAMHPLVADVEAKAALLKLDRTMVWEFLTRTIDWGHLSTCQQIANAEDAYNEELKRRYEAGELRPAASELPSPSKHDTIAEP